MHSRLRSTEISTSRSTKSTEGTEGTEGRPRVQFQIQNFSFRSSAKAESCNDQRAPPSPPRESSMKVDLCVSSFPNANTSSRVVVFRVRRLELPVRLTVLRSRVIASRIRLVILSVRFVGWSLRFVVLRGRLITDHPGSSSFVIMPFRRFVMAFHRGYNSAYIT